MGAIVSMLVITLRAFVTRWLVTLAVAFPYNAFAQDAPTAAPPAATAPVTPSAETPPPNASQPNGNTETPAVVINGKTAQTLLGKPVLSLKGEALGHIVDVIVDSTGMMRAAIIDFGGFLGVGTRKIAVDWSVLHFPPDGSMDKLIADLPRNQLQTAPIFKEGEPIVIMGRVSTAPTAAPPPSAPAPPPAAPITPPQASSATQQP